MEVMAKLKIYLTLQKAKLWMHNGKSISEMEALSGLFEDFG